MRGRNIRANEGPLYNALLSEGANRLRAGQLQNLHNYCKFDKFNILTGDNRPQPNPDAVSEADFNIFTESCPVREIEEHWNKVCTRRGAAAVFSPRADKERYRVCMALSSRGDCISIDNRAFVLFFFGTGLAPRHYKL